MKFAGFILSLVAAAAAVSLDGITQQVDLQEASDGTNRYYPDYENVYHLFTRQNPQRSQIIPMNSNFILINSNFDPSKRTIILVHGWRNNVYSDFNNVLVPAFLEAEDVNVIVVDWYAGSGMAEYSEAVLNVPSAAEGIARYITWLNGATGASLSRYHLVGHGLGGHLVGVISRNLGRTVAYITSLDPDYVYFVINYNKVLRSDGVYVEVIHTNAGADGYLSPLGDVDFYPNGGRGMPGCASNECDRNRSFHYLAESLRQGGFRGNRCSTYLSALTGICLLPGNLEMGGLEPKTGHSGVYVLSTNAAPPFSRS